MAVYFLGYLTARVTLKSGLVSQIGFTCHKGTLNDQMEDHFRKCCSFNSDIYIKEGSSVR